MRRKKTFLIALCLCAWSLIIIIIYNNFLLIRQTDTSQDAPRTERWILKNLKRERSARVYINNLTRQNDYLKSNRLKSQEKISDSQRLISPKNTKPNPTINVPTDKSTWNGGIDNRIIDFDFDNYKDDSNSIDRSNMLVEIDTTDSGEGVVDEQTKLDARLRELNKNSDNLNGPIIPVLVIACNRISVNSCLHDLVRYRPNAQQFPIIVSQDCDHEATKNVIKSYGKNVTYMRHPEQSDFLHLQSNEKKYKGYYKISRHYGWALNVTFKAGFEYVIIVEDDLNVAPDFYEYFLATHELLKNDSSLWCISAWNDNGKYGNIEWSKPELLYRSDFFPGLGWMMTKQLWDELSVKWPKAFWDDWIRLPKQRKGRACIRPELPRTRTFGKTGVSGGQFYENHLQFIKLNEKFVDFTKKNLTYLLKSNYNKQYIDDVYSRPLVTINAIRPHFSIGGSVRIQYSTKSQFDKIAEKLGIMDDEKSGIPRTAYQGIVSTYHRGRRIYVAPNTNWKGYDSWIHTE